MVAISIPNTASAQGTPGHWTKIFEIVSPPPPPPAPPASVAPARTSYGLVYDSSRDRMIAFGGDPGPKNDVWALSMVPGSQWENLNPSGSPPSERYGVSVIYDAAADRLIVFGGFDHSNRLNDVWQLTLSGTPTWSQLTPGGVAPTPRQDAAAVYDAIGNRMVVFGGYTQANTFSNETWTLSLTGSPAWTLMTPAGTPPSGRNTVGYALDTSRRHLIVSGGWSFSGYHTDTYKLDLSGAGAWSSISTSSSPPARRQSSGAYDAGRDRFVIFGGFNGAEMGDSWELTLGASRSWTQVFPSGGPPENRAGHAAIYDPVRQRMVIHAGHSFTHFKDVWARSLDATPTWTVVHSGVSPPSPPPATPASPDGVAPGRTSFGMVLDTSRDRVLVFGGDPGPTNDVYALPLAPGSEWSYRTSTTPAPWQRYGPGALHDPVGDRLIIFGGYNLSNQLNDTWALSLAGSESWSEIVAANPPSPRQDAATIYDPVGQRVVIFGGYNSSEGFLNEVWTLTLTGTPTWTQVTPSGTPPSGRNTMMYGYDSARNRLVLFGGYNGSIYESDTWALDLAGSMSWTQITTATSPPARRQGLAAYDALRDKLMFFGGFNGVLLADTWELSLSGTPDWTPITPVGAGPSARGGGRAIYDPTRQRLVLYGGYSDTEYPREVWALSLDGTPTWSLVRSGEGQISARRDYVSAHHPAANAIYMFGGTGPAGDNNETWKMTMTTPYTWQRVSVGAVRPSARHGHRGVWDPVRQRMIVFGGYGSNGSYLAYLDDLWAFVPAPTPHWEQLVTGGSAPQGRMLSGLVYDPVSDRLILMAGHAGDPAPFFNDVYELPLSGPLAMQWNPLTPAGTPPSPRWLYGTQYDPPRHRVLVYGGVTATGRSNELWALSLGGTPTWSQPTTVGPTPTVLSDHAMVYDPLEDRMVIFGGYDNANFRNDVTALNLSTGPMWVPLSPTGGPPVGRDIIQGVYDPAGGRMVVHGGWSGVKFLNDTWTLQWTSPPTAVQASLIDFQVEPRMVRLNWFVRSTSPAQSVVERRTEGSEWTEMGSPEATATDRLTFEDRSVSPGQRYSYRLKVNEGGEITRTDEVLVSVPNAFELELAGATPNPVSGDRLSVAFTLATRSKARIDLIDVAGRQIASRNLDTFEPGRHRILFGEGRRLEPGLYLIRLSTPGRVLTAKAMVVR